MDKIKNRFYFKSEDILLSKKKKINIQIKSKTKKFLKPKIKIKLIDNCNDNQISIDIQQLNEILAKKRKIQKSLNREVGKVTRSGKKLMIDKIIENVNLIVSVMDVEDKRCLVISKIDNQIILENKIFSSMVDKSLEILKNINEIIDRIRSKARVLFKLTYESINLAESEQDINFLDEMLQKLLNLTNYSVQ